ncbi:metallophosphoesterase [Desulfocarbo indianensis]|nr:metallophosphoesterase [Desulfocarbo indianensis]
MINILFIGDIFGEPGRRALERLLPRLRDGLEVDLVVANGENAAGGLGLTARLARELWGCGVDVITTGNHVWKQRDLLPMLDEEDRVLRPANYPAGTPGHGHALVQAAGVKIGVVNLQGRVYMNELDDPFRCLDGLLAGPLAGAAIVVVDMHAEASSEKQALAWHVDGQVAAVVGTHTHVQTADEKILPGGTAFITDLGFTGPHRSVIGMDPKAAIERFLSQRPLRFKVAKGDTRLQGALVKVDESVGQAVEITRLNQAME